MPDIRGPERDELIQRYLREVEALNTEPVRSHRFSMLLQALFTLDPGFIENYAQGVEKYLKVRQKDRVLRGQADHLFGNVILEFEADLAKTRAEAEEQLRRYTAILWSQEPADARTPYLCVATDGVRFITYTPVLDDFRAAEVVPEAVRLQILEEVDWRQVSQISTDEVFFWLDRYLLRQEIYSPTSERIEKDFGLKSHAFQTANATLLTLWRQVKDQDAFAVIFDAWDKYLRIVYGGKVAADEMFVRHTYLATLAKLLAWQRLTENTELPGDDQVLRMLEGRLYKELEIDNFLEEDFFSWLARPPAHQTALRVVRALFSLLRHYRLRELSEDVLKALYQELVDPETRHDLGEYYTPDWLAHRMINKMLDANPQGAILDPACGSGTFLYLTIREKIARLGRTQETLAHILENVAGADIHPLAIITAKTNFILGLGDLLKQRRRSVSIPVYLADTVALPERKGYAYPARLYRKVIVHEELVEDLTVYNLAVELAKDFAEENRGQPVSRENFQRYLAARNFPAHQQTELVKSLFHVSQALKTFIEEGKDTIWAFILKNILKPLSFLKKFDFILGNPPWISFRYLDREYQKEVRGLIRTHRLLTGRGHLITHMEVGTLFLVRAADLYLKEGGTIGFVLPRAVMTADQHDELRRGTFRLSRDSNLRLTWQELWDCEQVAPLFNVPCCVLWAQKIKPVSDQRPLLGEVLAGELPRKNASLIESEAKLTVTPANFSLHRHGHRTFWAPWPATVKKGPSYYRDKFYQGATIVPRSFWFVQVKPSPLGFNPEAPPLVTDPRALKEAKKPYQDVCLSGQVERRFLYATLLSTDLLPFGHLPFRLVVLPIEPHAGRYLLLDAAEARKQGFSYLARWLEKVEQEWARRRGAKAKGTTALEWLDYRKKLTSQSSQLNYYVTYITSGTILTASLVINNNISFLNNGQEVHVSGFISDCVTYFYETNSVREAYYLVSLLNAPSIDRKIKPMQARGLWGPRHIHKKVLELPIPQFDGENPEHVRLAELGERCAAMVKDWLAHGGPGQIRSIGRLRQIARNLLHEELKEIDGLVKKVFE